MGHSVLKSNTPARWNPIRGITSHDGTIDAQPRYRNEAHQPEGGQEVVETASLGHLAPQNDHQTIELLGAADASQSKHNLAAHELQPWTTVVAPSAQRRNQSWCPGLGALTEHRCQHPASAR